ncbi:hypothetical protein BpHYR1_038988 [Brachionus plicatilis]|uniref:Uncharacterized protein n=1 Tax=Brachionus plicatilis TaxID=10195 RepID=A0A3M7R7C0_BRAPC|nr:hypothetical protein BpHYR1_038988 [Brachionus plicatilis]
MLIKPGKDAVSPFRAHFSINAPPELQSYLLVSNKPSCLEILSIQLPLKNKVSISVLKTLETNLVKCQCFRQVCKSDHSFLPVRSDSVPRLSAEGDLSKRALPCDELMLNLMPSQRHGSRPGLIVSAKASIFFHVLPFFSMQSLTA